MKFSRCLILPLLFLAGCDSPAPADKAERPPTGLSAEAPAKAPEPAAGAAIAADAAALSIPASIQGRWGLVAADCTSNKGDAKGLLTIDGKSLRFYESLGTLAKVRERSATRLVADFSFIGEGMEWQRGMTLDVQDNGQTLIRREDGEGAAPGAFKYSRCT